MACTDPDGWGLGVGWKSKSCSGISWQNWSGSPEKNVDIVGLPLTKLSGPIPFYGYSNHAYMHVMPKFPSKPGDVVLGDIYLFFSWYVGLDPASTIYQKISGKPPKKYLKFSTPPPPKKKKKKIQFCTLTLSTGGKPRNYHEIVLT